MSVVPHTEALSHESHGSLPLHAAQRTLPLLPQQDLYMQEASPVLIVIDLLGSQRTVSITSHTSEL